MSKKLIKQSFVLYASSVVSLLMGFAVSMVNTSILDVSEFGMLKLVQQIFSLTAILLSLGVSYSTGRLLGLNKEYNKEGYLIATTIVFYLSISFISIIIIYSMAYLLIDFFSMKIKEILIFSAPLIVITIFSPVINNILQGLNRIYLLSFFRFSPQALYLIFILVLTTMSTVSLKLVLFTTYLTAGIVTVFCIVKLKPKFTNIKENYLQITKENKLNGFPVYIGSIAAVGSGNLLGVFLGLYIDVSTLGFYTLALMIATGLQMLPSVIASTLFRDFVTSSKISTKTLVASFIIGIISLIVFLLLIEDLVLFVYSEDYKPVIYYSKILAAGALLHGFGDVFNRFLGAKGQGVKLRNGSFITGGVILTLSVFLLPLLGGDAAPIIKTSGSSVYFLTMLTYYIFYIKNSDGKK
jgi:O-antigen/teichoic acid export membrane protein